MKFLLIVIALVSFVTRAASAKKEGTESNDIRVTLLGTGTPFVDPNRFGAAVLVEAGGKKLLFDCGRGAVIRLKQVGIQPEQINGLFLTHLHSDHVVGIPDLWLTGWFLGRKEPLRILGPTGTRSLAEHLAEAFSFDINIRSANGMPREGVAIDAQEVHDGKVYKDGFVRVTAFTVNHGSVKPALGYRVDYAGHSAVISGDTNFSENLVRHAKGTDCLVHVAWSTSTKDDTPPSKRSLATAEDAARVFSAVTPKLAVVYHYYDEQGLAEAVRSNYKGQFAVGRDLMRIEIGRTVTWRMMPVTGVSR